MFDYTWFISGGNSHAKKKKGCKSEPCVLLLIFPPPPISHAHHKPAFISNIVIILTKCNVGFLVFTVRKYKTCVYCLKAMPKILSILYHDAVERPIRDYIPISIKGASRRSARALYIPSHSKQRPVACSSGASWWTL